MTLTISRQICATAISAVAILRATNLFAVDSTLPNRPNINFIIADQMLLGDMSYAGNPYLKTPALDGLATTGERFALLGCAFFIRRDYPDELRISDRSESPVERAAPVSKPDQPKELTDIGAAEKNSRFWLENRKSSRRPNETSAFRSSGGKGYKL